MSIRKGTSKPVVNASQFEREEERANTATVEFEKMYAENQKLKKQLEASKKEKEKLENKLTETIANADLDLKRQQAEEERRVAKYSDELETYRANHMTAKEWENERKALEKENQKLEFKLESLRKQTNSGAGNYVSLDGLTEDLAKKNERYEQLLEDTLMSSNMAKTFAVPPDEQAAEIEKLNVEILAQKSVVFKLRLQIGDLKELQSKVLPPFLYEFVKDDKMHILIPATLGLPYNREVKNQQWHCDVCKMKCTWYCVTCYMVGPFKPQVPYVCAFDCSDCWDCHVKGHSFRLKRGFWKEGIKQLTSPSVMRTAMTAEERNSHVATAFEEECGYSWNVQLTLGLRKASVSKETRNVKAGFLTREVLSKAKADKEQEVKQATVSDESEVTVEEHAAVGASAASSGTSNAKKALILPGEGLNPLPHEEVDIIEQELMVPNAGSNYGFSAATKAIAEMLGEDGVKKIANEKGGRKGRKTPIALVALENKKIAKVGKNKDGEGGDSSDSDATEGGPAENEEEQPRQPSHSSSWVGDGRGNYVPPPLPVVASTVPPKQLKMKTGANFAAGMNMYSRLQFDVFTSTCRSCS